LVELFESFEGSDGAFEKQASANTVIRVRKTHHNILEQEAGLY
jgi:hypothetical protein